MDNTVEDDPAPLRVGPGVTPPHRAGRLGSSRSQEPATVAPRTPSRVLWLPPVLAFGVMTSLLLAYLCQSAQIVRSQYRIVAVRGEVRELQAEKYDLELSVCELTALERIEKHAIEKLSMAIPTQRRVIEVSWQKALEKGSEVAALP